MLSVDDDLPYRPRRILVAGVSGVGKTTFAQAVSQRLALPRNEIDALFHGPAWTPREEFLDDVRALAATEAWVTEWQYADARPLLADRAELLVWLDLPFRVTLGRVVRRTIRRRVRREVLWNGNREAPLWTILTNREHIVWWAVSTRRLYAELVPALADTHPHLAIVRLRSAREAEEWLARFGPGDGQI